MSDKASKRPPGKRAGGAGDEPGVLGSLPSSRPSRLARQGPGAGGGATSGRRATAKRASKAAPARTSGPRAVRAGAPSLGAPAGASSPPRPAEGEDHAAPPSGTELLTTALRATGELVQIGATLAGLLVRRVLRGLPRR